MIQFTHPPENYRSESTGYSHFWFVWLPVLSIPILVIFSYFFQPFALKWLVSEKTGLIEFTNALFPLITAIIALRMLTVKAIRSDWFLVFWCVALLVGGVYLAGEESSWGQHYVGWTTPGFWQGVNDQQETNLHNISHWFDQKPRLVLIAGIYVTGIINPWLHLNRPHLLPRRLDFVYPALILVPLALCVLATHLLTYAPQPIFSLVYQVLRTGELQELYITWYLLAYAVVLYWRARTLVN